MSVFIKMNIEHAGAKSPDECQKINEYHKKPGFNFEIKSKDMPSSRKMENDKSFNAESHPIFMFIRPAD